MSAVSFSQKINRETFFNDSEEELIGIPEKLPVPIGGPEAFYESIEEKSPTTINGKVYVGFVVDTVGRAQCATVVKTDSEPLNDLAIALIEETRFAPAGQRGKKKDKN